MKKKINEFHNYNKLNYVELSINRKNDDYSSISEVINKNNIKIYHSPNNGFSLPQNKECTYISTIHELYALSNEEKVDEKYCKKFYYSIPKAIINSDKIIVVSDFIKSELKSYFNIKEDKVKTIYPGCSKIFKPISKEVVKNYLHKKYNLDDEYILFCGSIHPRKQLEKFIYIFSKIQKKIPKLKFVIIGKINGKRSNYYNKLKENIKKLDIQESVIFMNMIEQKYMTYFYCGAKCVVDFSEYEGFPMNCVEALKCNTPVICTNSSSFKEILDKKAMYVDIERQNLIEDLIIELITNEKYREKKIQLIKCFDEENKYTWKHSIDEHVKVYEEFLS
ncbi:glycosyltransferase family 4 protein [Haloimpatiens sp. FM7330]|uniref:glycosyltransferase family 4 protein n=1 Tax=Haloimpatiens sp. FM7330 TaxID=3298610 RepID=UPI00364321A0